MPKNTYRLKDGTPVPGTTTICNQLGKGDGITNWAHKIAYDSTIEITHELWVRYGGSEKLYIPKYEDIQKWQGVRDSAGDIGTLVHEYIMSNWTDKPFDISVYSPEQIELIEKCYAKFDMWACDQAMEEPTLIEQPLVSEKLRFGGQPDLYVRVKGKNRLIDVKTSSGIYDSYWYQLAGYDILLKENGYKVDEYQILWLPKDNRFACPIRTDLRKEKRIFEHLLGIYYDRRA